MPYDDDDDIDDRDDPQPDDIADLDRDDDDGDEKCRRCPACGAAFYDGAPRCPHCGEWVTADSPAERRARGWLWPVVIVGLIVALLFVWHGIGW